MGMLDDLKSIDLSGIAQARAGITVSVSADGVRAVVSGGAVTSALGDLGAALASSGAALSDPAELFAPLADAFGALASGLGERDLPVAELVSTVGEGVGVIASLLDGLADDPLAIGRVLGRSLPDALGTVARAVDDYQAVGLDELGHLAGMVATLERGPVSDPRVLAELAIDALTPFQPATLDRLRAGVAAVLDALDAVALPTTRTQGLVAHLDAVATAAGTGDVAAVRRALTGLERARVELHDVLRTDLAALTSAIDRIPVAVLTGAVTDAGGMIGVAGSGILELFAEWAAQLPELTAVIEDLDPRLLTDTLRGWLDKLEAFLREEFEAGVDATVDLVVGKVRELFAHLPIRRARAAVSDALHEAVGVVADADLDGPVDAVRAVLRQVRDALDVVDLGDRVQDSLGAVAGTLHDALDGVITAIDEVRSAIEAVAGPAAAVLGRAAGAVRAFQESVAGVTAALDAIDPRAAAAEVIARVRKIREAVEGVVSTVPLPEPVRPLVTQLVDQLEALNLDAVDLKDVPVLGPLLSAVGRLHVSESLNTVVHEGLSALRDAAGNLVPASLIAGIEAEIGSALEVVGGFDPATLFSGVTEQINAVADTLDGVDFTSAAQAAHAPFQTLLDAWDTVRPGRLLAPASQAYESAIGAITIPSPETALRGFGEMVTKSGEEAGQVLAAPITKVAPEGTTLTPPATASGGSGGAPGTPEDLSTLRAGDVVRMFGYLPAKLRAALAALDATAAGAALDAMDGLVAGLARDLRATGVAVARIETGLDTALDTLLMPLGPAQARAQLALHARFAVETQGLDLRTALATVSRTGPGAVRADLAAPADQVRARAAGMIGRHAGVARRLNTMADALERCRLAELTGDLDGLLAALDPEPLAAEVDALAAAAYRATPALITAIGAELRALLDRFRALVGALNPGAMAGRFVNGVLEVLREQLALFDPRVLAAELDEPHGAVRATLAAYDPAVLVGDLAAVRDEIVANLRGLDPAALLGDLTGLTDLVAKVGDALPANLRTGLPDQLTELDEAFAEVDLDVLLDRMAHLGDEMIAAFGTALTGIRDEIVALLESLRFATGRIQAGVEVGGEVRTG